MHATLGIVTELRDAKHICKAPKLVVEALHQRYIEGCHARIAWDNECLPFGCPCTGAFVPLSVSSLPDMPFAGAEESAQP